MKTNENLTEKLNIIGLDFKNIPDKFNSTPNINFNIHKNYNEKNYKVYKYVDVNDIEIFLTPTHRLTEYTEKYAKALPLASYLKTDSEENMKKNLELLKLINELQMENLESLENQQKELNKNIPYNVNFYKDYIWQVHYSQISKKYFILVPIKESECTPLFYIIKKQIENKKQKIYVPICYSEYSNNFLSNSKMEDMENFLCFFAKDWPMTYEVYDKEDNMSMQILGKATIYDTLKTEYKIEFKNREEAENYYKLLKALFILETQLSHHYKFDIKLDRKGLLHFYYEKEEIDYKELMPFIKREYIKGLEKTIKSKEIKINLDKKLKTLRQLAKKLEQDYFEKEKQISTFLECKKTFLGRVKYFIKYKNKKAQTIDNNIPEEENNKIKYCERTEIKETYTLEELLTLYTNLDHETATIKDLGLDINAINKRIDTLQIKIKNATIYIKEIDKHKKSIFDFWKFTNKDDAKQLNEGTTETIRSRKLKKAFNYELDMEDISKQLDKEQRKIFSKDETDNIYIATTEIIDDINRIINKQSISEGNLIKLKKDMLNNKEAVTFDIFGSISSAGDRIKTLGNIKHREDEKNKFAILNLKENTTLEDYTNKLKDISISIQESIEKCRCNLEMPIYRTGKLEEGLNVFYINPEEALQYAEGKEANLYKITIKENTNSIALTNIIYYNNNNKTLPLGMNVVEGILIDTKNINLKIKKKAQNYVIKADGDLPKPNILKLNIYEYEICEG